MRRMKIEMKYAHFRIMDIRDEKIKKELLESHIRFKELIEAEEEVQTEAGAEYEELKNRIEELRKNLVERLESFKNGCLTAEYVLELETEMEEDLVAETEELVAQKIGGCTRGSSYSVWPAVLSGLLCFAGGIVVRWGCGIFV